jgi:predicted nuclease of predicted toxin-antitoxin system
MRVVLDSCVPRTLAPLLVGCSVETTRRMRLENLDDGPLLDALAGRCELFLTVDANMRFQQSMASRPFAIAILRVLSNRLEDIAPLVPDVLQRLPFVRPGDVIELSKRS